MGATAGTKCKTRRVVREGCIGTTRRMGRNNEEEKGKEETVRAACGGSMRAQGAQYGAQSRTRRRMRLRVARQAYWMLQTQDVSTGRPPGLPDTAEAGCVYRSPAGPTRRYGCRMRLRVARRAYRILRMQGEQYERSRRIGHWQGARTQVRESWCRVFFLM